MIKQLTAYSVQRAGNFTNAKSNFTASRKLPPSNNGKPRQSRGFTLLMSVLISGILLSIGFAIYNIVAKDLILSSAGRESLFAFYAADSGVECALYNDKLDTFATTTTISGEPVINCLGTSLDDANVETYVSGTNDHITTFRFSFNANPNLITATEPCTTVVVTRNDEAGGVKSTIITSSGYNTCVADSPRRTERTLRVDF